MRGKKALFVVTLVGLVCFSQITYVSSFAASPGYDSTYSEEVVIENDDQPSGNVS